MKILVVEDDNFVTQTLQLLFSNYGYAVDTAVDGEAGRQLADAYEYDLVLLDVGLPKVDGITLCQQLRATGSQVPILFLTGQGEGRQTANISWSAATALNAGADDYVVKPFDTEELVARVQALLRRGGPTSQPTLTWGQLSIDPSSCKVIYSNHLVSVTPKEYAILELLLRYPQKALSARTIVDRVWNSIESPGEESVRVHIKELRQKLMAVGAPKDLIITKHRVGYQLNNHYSNFLAVQAEQQLTAPQVAELTAMNQELRLALEELQVAQEELQHQNEQLELFQQKLELERQRYRDLFRLAPDAIAICTDEGFYVDANPAMGQLIGIDREALLRSRMTDFIDLEDNMFFWQQLLQQGQMTRELNLHRPDGAVRIVEMVAIANLVPGRHLAILRDISDYKHQQSELYEQVRQELAARQQMQVALSHAVEGISQLDEQGNYISVNEAFARMLGYPPTEIVGMSWQSTIHPDDLDEATVAYQRMQSQGKVELEVKAIRKDGSIFYTQLSMVAAYNDQQQLVGHYCFSKDISEKKQLEADCKLTEQKMREQAALLDIASDAIFVRDLDNTILYWNQGAERLYGWQATEAIGQKANELLQNRNFLIEKSMQKLLEQGEWRGEIHKITKSGKQVTVEARWTLVQDEAGQPQSILVVETDVTEKKQLEIQFYQAQRLESLGRLTSGIAHDLNNIFTPILSMAQMLRLTQQNLDAKAQEQLKLLEESAKRGASMVKQVLSLTRGSRAEKTTVNLTDVLWEVINFAQESFPKSIDIHPNLPPPDNPPEALRLVSADPTHLTQVFMNLCVNARDAMPQGGVLTIAAENTFVDEGTAQANLDAQTGVYVVVTISDTGTGISPEVRDRMFDPFFTTKEPGQGTGLGLATVLRIIRTYDGFLQVCSAVGQGTHMKVYVPALDLSSHHYALPEKQEEQQYGNGELILIVDDDIAVQQTTRSLLKNYHYTPLVANEGKEAIALYKKHQAEIRLVVLDITMPKMNGIELIQRLRLINPDVKIIAVSGLPANREPSLEAGASTFLAKPYSLATFLKQIYRWAVERHIAVSNQL